MILSIHKRNYVYIKYKKKLYFHEFFTGFTFFTYVSLSYTNNVTFNSWILLKVWFVFFLYYFNNVPCHFSKVHDSISLTTDIILFVHVINAFIKYDYTVIQVDTDWGGDLALIIVEFGYNYVVVFSFLSARPKQVANNIELQVAWQRLKVKVSVNHTTNQPDESALTPGSQGAHSAPQTT